MTFVEASRIVLEKNLNNPMTASQIWDKIIESGLISEYGKTPKASLNTILHRSSLFVLIEDKPADKFIYKRYVSTNVKESLIEQGFITEERVLEILKEKLKL